MEKKLLIFTYADTNYDIFVLPYITFALISNPDAIVEIAVEDIKSFNVKYGKGVEQLRTCFGNDFLIRQSKVVEDKVNCTPNVVRFLEIPQLKAEFLYIGDIDLMILDNVYNIHMGYIERFNLPFSNIIRLPIKGGEPRLTGLHFCYFEQMYPLPDLSDVDLKNKNDEHILYLIMKRNGYMVPEDFRLRPECGLHLSTNRDPMGRYIASSQMFKVGNTVSWGVHSHNKKDKYHDVQRNQIYQKCFMYFPTPFKLMLVALEGLFENSSDILHRYAMNFLVDKSTQANGDEIKRVAMMKQGDELISNKRYEEALSLFQVLVNVWPSIHIHWMKLLNVSILTNNYTLSRVAVRQLKSMNKGQEVLDSSDLYDKFLDSFKELIEKDAY